MKEYTFEYTKQGFDYLLFILSFAIIVIGLFVLSFFRNEISPAIATIVLIASSVAFFLLNKHRIKKTGNAKLSETDLVLELNEIKHIVFDDLRYHYICGGKNGLAFTLGFNDKTKLKVTANNNFCDDELFKTFLTDFQSVITEYNSTHQISIIHLESIFARKRTVYTLSLLTIIIVLGFYFTHMPLMIIPIGLSASVSVGWIKYFILKSQGKLIDL